ncbi:MAG TPA: AtpZ/AtpI family protein [Candidatus Saccharimonadales bacterium]
MSTSSDKHDTPAAPPDHSTVVFMLGTIADTTWRMFVPTVGLMCGGYWADQTFGTKPWLFIVGLVVGSGIAILLVKQQLTKKKV